MTNQTQNKFVHEDLIRLRDEIAIRAFDSKGGIKDSTLAEIVYKMNSCLYKGYPRKD